MKRILLALMVILTMCSLAGAQSQTTVLKDSVGKVKVKIKKTKDAKADIQSTAVTVIGTDSTVTDSTDINDASNQTSVRYSTIFDDDNSPFNFLGAAFGTAVLIPIIAIISVFGLPIFILFLVFFFRYKNRKARYRLAEQALAAGQPIPEGFFKEYRQQTDQRTQGIKNTFLGIGLFIFLWAITGEFGIGTIGLLIMFMGIGQWLIGNQHEKKNEQSDTIGQVFKEKKNEEKNEEN